MDYYNDYKKEVNAYAVEKVFSKIFINLGIVMIFILVSSTLF